MRNTQRSVRVEFVGDINTEYPYLEVFLNEGVGPFIEIGVSPSKELYFKYWATDEEIVLCADDIEYLLSEARDFLPYVLKNEEDNRRHYGL